MDSIEFTKYASIVLVALLLIFGGRVLIQELGHHKQTTVGYELEKPAEGGTATAKAAPAAGFDAAKVVAAMSSADAASGEKVLKKKCAICHSWNSGGATKLGPNLWSIVDRKIAGVDGFNYSAALSGKGENWTLENLASFLHKPSKYAKGTMMAFAGIKKDKELADLLAYLNSLK